MALQRILTLGVAGFAVAVFSIAPTLRAQEVDAKNLHCDWNNLRKIQVASEGSCGATLLCQGEVTCQESLPPGSNDPGMTHDMRFRKPFEAVATCTGMITVPKCPGCEPLLSCPKATECAATDPRIQDSVTDQDEIDVLNTPIQAPNFGPRPHQAGSAQDKK